MLVGPDSRKPAAGISASSRFGACGGCDMASTDTGLTAPYGNLTGGNVTVCNVVVKARLEEDGHGSSFLFPSPSTKDDIVSVLPATVGIDNM